MEDLQSVRKDARAVPVQPFFIKNAPNGLGNTSIPYLAEEARRVGESSRMKRTEESRQNARLPMASELFVPSLPGLPHMAQHPTHPLTVYAGNIPSYPGEGQGGGDGDTGKDAMLFFMMIKARRSAGKQRVVLWFNGGPGCSSFDGSLMEVGPFRTVPAAQSGTGQVELKLVEGGWEEFAHVVFVDQPPGTGFSYAPTNGYLHELGQGAQHLIQFLSNFYTIFPEMAGLDTYLAGESFAGQYIPYFGDALIKTNRLPGFNLKGLAIGNGWIDPIRQYPAYAEFGYEKGLIKPNTPEANNLDAVKASCIEAMKKWPDSKGFTPVNINECQGVMGAVEAPFEQELNGRRTCMNVYDVRLVDDWPACGMNWPPDLPDVYTFLRRPDVVNALHANAKETAWVECDGKVSGELHNFQSTASVDLIPGILEAGVPIMLFAGAEDLICNYKGIERITENLSWGGIQGMSNATHEQWWLNGTQVGTWQTSRNLSYVKVFDSSHMVGFDVPHVTNDMILRFMDVDLSLLPGWAASSSSKLGDIDRIQIGPQESKSQGVPLFKGGKSNREEWYNAISAFMILFILLGIVALYFYFRRKGRMRRRGVVALAGGGNGGDGSAEERVPLGRMDPEAAEEYDMEGLKRGGSGKHRSNGSLGKGKMRAVLNRSSRDGTRDADGQVVFALGDDDEDGGGRK